MGGSSRGTETESGTYPRARRIIRGLPSGTDSTLSSSGVRISRSCHRTPLNSGWEERKASASPSRITIGAPDRFRLVRIRGPSARVSRICRGLEGSMAPIRSLSEQTEGAKSRFFRSKTIGRGEERSKASSSGEIAQNDRTPGISGNKTAKGFFSRCFRVRRARAVSSRSGRAARW